MLFLAGEGLGIFRWVGDFFERLFTKFSQMFSVYDNLIEGVQLIEAVFYLAPNFLIHILAATLAIAIIMWVVNLF